MRVVSNSFFVGVFLLVFIASLAGCEDRRETELQTSVRTRPVDPPVGKPAPELITAQAAFIDVSSRVTPAVVNIRAARISRSRDPAPLLRRGETTLYLTFPVL